MPAAGSVVGSPAASSAQPRGIERPSLRRHHQLAARDFAQAQVDHQRLAAELARRVAAAPTWKDRRDRIGAEDRMAPARRRHRRRRVGEAEADHAGRRDRTQVIDDDAGVMAVAHADEGDAELRGAADRLFDRQRAGGKCEPSWASTMAAAGFRRDERRQRSAVDAAVAQVRRVLGDAAEPVRRQPLRFGQHQRPRRRFGHRLRPRRRGAGPPRRAPSRRPARASAVKRAPPAPCSAMRQRHPLVRLGRDAGDVRRQQQIRAAREGVVAGERFVLEDVERRAAEVTARAAPRRRPPRRRCRRAPC